MKERLYNGIEIDDGTFTYDSSSVSADRAFSGKVADVIPVDVGRQLFFDDFLIEDTDCRRVFHHPEWFKDNPVLFPETEEELDNGDCPMAAPFNDGVWFDQKTRKFRMWYMPGWMHTTALAESDDGIHWVRHLFDVVPGTNLVFKKRKGYERDGALIWIDDFATNEKERYKMFQFFRLRGADGRDLEEGGLYISADGIHWDGPVVTDPVGDNSCFFYNPFRRKWCMSIRRNAPTTGRLAEEMPVGVRKRYYKEDADFLHGAAWDSNDEVLWQTTDPKDLPDPAIPDHNVALYDVNVVAYESVMIGLFGIFRGPENHICQEKGIPKTIDLEIGFSRDGFNFTRPDRTPFLAASRIPGTWNKGYLHASGGVCLVFEDKIRFYVTGFSGISPNLSGNQMGRSGRYRNAMYAGASVGIAELRRDGFASMHSDQDGYLLTKPLRFSGSFLFMNCDASKGCIKVEVLDEAGNVLPGYSKEECKPIESDSVKTVVTWDGGASLSSIKGKTVRFRFIMDSSDLYSFWISDDLAGHSNGFVAAGSPDYPGPIDE